ncbi:hypothetical protein C2G38_2041274 [Gigaspora rosea]|uniref:Uncharacterized protein n=1 Tax=Gigaspora rosea TaxID=44941 RepID=A0A397UWE8_9GLOM|nr:hypothetical protein C2G38_2041274 [Gigaspora rosea]
MEESITPAKRKTFVQTKLNFPVALDGSFTEKRLQDNPPPINIDTNQVTKPSSTNKARGNRKIPTLQKFLKDSNLEKIDSRHIYCHYCDTGQPITLHRINDSYRLWQHLETSMHKENVEREQANPSKKYRTTFLHFEKKKQKETLNTEPYSEPSKKVCYGFYSKSFAVLARYGTSTDNYKILRDDDLFDGKVKAHRYIQSKQCEGYTMSKYCSKYSILPQLESVQKRNQRYQELIAQIDCLFILKEGQSIPASFISRFGNTWTQYNISKLYELVVASLKNRPSKTKSTELEQLYKFIKKEIKDYSYYTTIKKYPALGHIIEAVETHGLENWIGQCMVYLIDKTMEEKRPVFVGMAQAITKVIDKLQRGVTSMRGIGKYHESFIDFLIVFMSISTLATRWLTANLAGPTIRFLRYKRNEPDIDYDIYGIKYINFFRYHCNVT